MRRFTPIILCLLFLSISCQKKESLWSVEKVNSIHKKIDSLSSDSSHYYLKQIEHEISKNPSLDSLSLKNDYLLGNYFSTQGVLDSAAYYYQRTVDKVSDPLDYSKGYYYFFSAHESYVRLGKYGDCITIGKSFLNRIDSSNFRAKALGNLILSQAYKKLGDNEKSFFHNEQRIRMHLLTKDTSALFGTLINKADKLYYYKKNIKESFQLLDSLIDHEENMSLYHKRQLYNNYGVYQFLEGNFNKALDHYKKSLNFKKQMNNPLDKKSLFATSYANLAEVSIELKQYSNARKYLDTIKLLGIHNIPRHLRKSVLRYELKLANATNSNITSLYDHLDTIAKYQEQSYNEKIENELVELTKANEKEKQILQEKLETEIANANLKTSLLFGGVITSLLFSFGLLFYFRRKLKFERNSLQMQQRLLRSQMNPHFTFNTLYAIQNQIKKEPEKATNYLLKFSRLLRLFLENSMGDYIPLEKEVDSLKKYMDLQLLRMQNTFTYEFHYENMEEDEFLFIPPMLLQPFVENSIEHGFSDIDWPGKIIITLALQDKYIACTIEDNGKGLTFSKNHNKQSASTQLIDSFLKKSTKQGLEIIDRKSINTKHTGTLIRFSIPYTLTEEG